MLYNNLLHLPILSLLVLLLVVVVVVIIIIIIIIEIAASSVQVLKYSFVITNWR
jgi:hypothetical protein